MSWKIIFCPDHEYRSHHKSSRAKQHNSQSEHGAAILRQRVTSSCGSVCFSLVCLSSFLSFFLSLSLSLSPPPISHSLSSIFLSRPPFFTLFLPLFSILCFLSVLSVCLSRTTQKYGLDPYVQLQLEDLGVWVQECVWGGGLESDSQQIFTLLRRTTANGHLGSEHRSLGLTLMSCLGELVI